MSALFVFIALISLLPLPGLSFSIEYPADRRLLVLLDDSSLKSSHSIFFRSLETRGFELDFKLANDPKIALQRHGQYLYDGLILFAPSTERNSVLGLGGSLTLAGLLEFVDSGHDLIVSAHTSVLI